MSTVHYPTTHMYTTQLPTTYMPERNPYSPGRYSYETPNTYGGTFSSAKGPLKVVWEVAKLGIDVAMGVIGF